MTIIEGWPPWFHYTTVVGCGYQREWGTLTEKIKTVTLVAVFFFEGIWIISIAFQLNLA